mgnify:CR=1 FL=1
MFNSFYTTKTKTCQCPLWLTNVTITAKYRIHENSNQSAHLTVTECEIVRNLRLPKSKQNKELEMYRYCNHDDCPNLRGFPKEITLR